MLVKFTPGVNFIYKQPLHATIPKAQKRHSYFTVFQLLGSSLVKVVGKHGDEIYT